MESGKLSFIVDTATGSGDAKSILGSSSATGCRDISIETLKLNLEQACRGLSQAFSNLRQVGEFPLKQVTIGIEVSAEGGISFVGSAKAGAKGAITLTFGEG